MFKKILPVFIILLIVIPVVAFLFFFKDKQIPDSRIDAIEAVPVDAIMAFEAKSIPSLIQLFNTKPQIRDDLGLIDDLKSTISGLNKLDSILTQGEGNQAKFSMIPGILSIHQTGDDQFKPLLVLQTGGKLSHKDLFEVFQQLSNSDIKHSEKNYSRSKVHSYDFGESSVFRILHLAQVKKYLVISTSDLIIEDVIRQVKSGVNLNEFDDFRQAASVAGQNADANFYINVNRFGSIASTILSDPLVKFVESFQRYGSWIELDLTLRDEMIFGTGFGFSGDTVAWLDLFDNQYPPKNKLDRVFPASTIGLVSYGITNPELFFSKLSSVYQGLEIGKSRENKLSAMARSIGEDPVAAIVGLMDAEAAIAWIPGTEGSAEPVVVLSTKSQNMANEKFQDWLAIKARKEDKKLQDYRFTYNLDQERRSYIYEMPVNELPELLFGEMFSSVTGKYFSFVDNYMIISDKTQPIKDIIYFKELEKTLYTDPVYQSVISQIGMRNNFVFYLAPFRSEAFLSNRLNKKWTDKLADNEEFMKRLGAISLQIQTGNNSAFHNLFVRFSESEINKPQTIWESRLDTTLNFKPIFITNHNTKRKEILLQDEAHNLYLVNTSGRPLWKHPLKEAINSQVYQVDIYKNGKLQFLFSTESALHMIDRNGNYVDKYPVMLRAKASNGMALFDYENRKDYRIFIAGEDRGIYVYDKAGSLVKGWEFGKTEGIVNSEIQHYQIGSKDYIVAADPMNIYFLDRRGQVRVTPKRQFAKSHRNGLILDRQSSKGPRLVCTDVDGNVWYTYFSGDVEEIKTKGYSADHFFDYEDIDRDGRKDYIFADQDRIEVSSVDGKTIFEEKVDGIITHMPNIYTFPGNSREIGIVTRDQEKIYLFKSNGKLHDGFPLRGRTPFSIGYLDPGNKEFNLIVGGDDLFLLNYRVK
jgi:hypothetical protein